jgi:hypothetical protein
MKNLIRGFLMGAAFPFMFGVFGLALAVCSGPQACGLLWGSSAYVMAVGGLIGGAIGAMFGLARCISDQIVRNLSDDCG